MIVIKTRALGKMTCIVLHKLQTTDVLVAISRFILHSIIIMIEKTYIWYIQNMIVRHEL